MVAKDGQEYTRESIKDNQLSLLLPTIQMILANEESKQKSIRIRDARDREQQRYFTTGQKISIRAPQWLALMEDKITWQVNEPAAQAITRIHQLALEGKEYRGITMIMNRDKSYWSPDPKPHNPEGVW